MRDKIKRKEWTQRYYEINKEKIKARNKLRGKSNGWYESSRDPERRKISRSTNFAKIYKENKEAYLAKNSLSRQKLKSIALEKLGGSCKCCGIDEMEFLTIDHIDGSGSIHRKTLRESGKDPSLSVYRQIRDLMLDEAKVLYRVLCWNCNMSSHFGMGVCAHKRP